MFNFVFFFTKKHKTREFNDVGFGDDGQNDDDDGYDDPHMRLDSY